MAIFQFAMFVYQRVEDVGKVFKTHMGKWENHGEKT